MEENLPKLGRPTKYTPEDCDLLIDIRSRGYSISAFCVHRKISRNTFHEWKKNHTEFAEAIEIADDASKAFYEHRYLQIGIGESRGNVNALKEACDRQHGSIKATENKTEINIGNMNVLQTLSEAELQQRILGKMKNLNIITQEASNSEPEPPDAA